MRLINTTTLKAEEFFGDAVPEYAILSHTWGDCEASFQDWLYTQHQNPPRWGWSTNDDEIKQLLAGAGYHKIYKAAEESKRLRCEWLWVDTVCIDKSSSAELSEVINSMYSWYEGATVCIAHLGDVSNSSLSECEAADSEFRKSRWFTRGWTLQELIAPDNVSFYSKDWTLIGNRASLVHLVVEITTIPEQVLSRGWSPFESKCHGYSIAQKMSWAARRRTTRVEDRAYSLMGIFEINMPLLYGEGKNAFTRLMEEIIKRTHDQSFLATDSTNVLATGPLSFVPGPGTSPALLSTSQYDAIRNKPFLITNLGLSIHVAIAATLSDSMCLIMLASADLETVWRELWIPISYKEVLKGWTRSDFPAAVVRVRPTHLMRSKVKTVHRYIHSSVPATIWADVNGEFSHDCRAGVLLTLPVATTKFQLRESFPRTTMSNPEAPVLYLAKQPTQEHIYSAVVGISAKDGYQEQLIHLFFAVLFSHEQKPLLSTCRMLSTGGKLQGGARLADTALRTTLEIDLSWGQSHWMNSVALVMGSKYFSHRTETWTMNFLPVWVAQLITGVGEAQYANWMEKGGDYS